MDIVLAQTPASLKTLLEESLEHSRLSDPVNGQATLWHGLSDEECLELPYFLIDANQVQSTASLRSLQSAGWAFIVNTTASHSSESEYSLAHLIESDGQYHLTHLQHGWIPATLLDYATQARKGRWRKEGKSSLSILYIVGLRKIYIWFRSIEEKADRLVPLVRKDEEAFKRKYPRAITWVRAQRALKQILRKQTPRSNAPSGALRNAADFSIV